ncbi:uncharacterized protein [Asterias amurensis]|uniref:uncharacterized protein n=1 Tax=Asterias amurensis TaxID=7602 RepID=UPI003AB3A18A
MDGNLGGDLMVNPAASPHPGKLQETTMGLFRVEVRHESVTTWQLKIFDMWYLGIHWTTRTKLVQMGVEDLWICGLWTYLEVTKGPSLECVLPAKVETSVLTLSEGSTWSGAGSKVCSLSLLKWISWQGLVHRLQYLEHH